MFVTIYVSGKLGAKANRARTVVVGAETLAKRVYITEVTTYDYTPVDPSDPVLPVDTRPRTVVRKLDGIECERTYYVYSPLTNIVERVGNSWGHTPQNPNLMRGSGLKGADPVLAGYNLALCETLPMISQRRILSRKPLHNDWHVKHA